MRRVVPDHAGNARDQQDDRDEGPHRAAARQRVADQRVVRPVAGVGQARFTRTIGHRRPRRPEEERCQRPAVRRTGQGVVGHRVLIAQLFQRRRIAEQVAVVFCDRPYRHGALGGHRDRPARGVVGVAPQLGLECSVDRCTLGERQGVERALVCLGSQHVAQRDRFAVQPIGRPIGRHVAAMAPDRSQLLSSRGKPRLLAVLDVIACVEGGAVYGDHRLRDGWGGEIDFAAQPAQCGEREDEDDAQPLPEIAGRFHCGTPFFTRKDYKFILYVSLNERYISNASL